MSGDSQAGGKMTANVLNRVFALQAHGTNLRTEVLAGFATYLTMVYIVAVNPAILGEAGLPVGAVAVATCLAAGFASLLMGLAANTPLALAPGMGLNAYFTYTVVKGMGVPWETALGCVFLSGVVFLVLTLAGVRQLIVGAIPRSLYAAVAGGIGLFIAFIGLKDAGVIVASPATTVALGDLASPTAALALIGLVLIAVLQAWRVKAAILIGIVAISLASWGLGYTHVSSAAFGLSDLSATAFKFDVPAALNLKGGLGATLAEIVFVFLFVDLFDNVGTLVAVTKKAGLVAPDGTIPRLNRILLVDSLATMVGAAVGTSTVTSYIESAAGVASGGRTGLTSVVVGLLFLATLLLAPLVQIHPHSGHGAGPHPGGRDDGWHGGGGGLERPDPGAAGLPDPGDDPAHVLDRQRPGFWGHRLCPVADPHRQGAREGLAAVHPRCPVHRPVHLPCEGLTGRVLDRPAPARHITLTSFSAAYHRDGRRRGRLSKDSP